MQSSSSMQSTASMSVAAESMVQAADADIASSSKQLTQARSLTGLAPIVVFCFLCIFGLLISAFSLDPGTESNLIDCVTDSVASETAQTLMTFFMGWFCMFLLKQRRKLPEYCNDMLQAMIKFHSSVCSTAASTASTFAWLRPSNWRLEERAWLSKGTMSIIVVAVLCMLTISGLLVSAFAAVPDAEPIADGVATEVSTMVRYFTATWIFCLSLKLLHELVGLVGWSCIFQPW